MSIKNVMTFLKKLSYIYYKYCIVILIVFSLVYVLKTYLKYKKEGFTEDDMKLITNKGDAFCQNAQGSSNILEEKCNVMNHSNCNATSCCIWTHQEKCVAGDETGALFNTDKNGKTNTLDYYYFKGKCYGENCPK